MKDFGEGPSIEFNGSVYRVRFGNFFCRVDDGVGSDEDPYISGASEDVRNLAATLWNVAVYKSQELDRPISIYFKHNQATICLSPGEEEPVLVTVPGDDKEWKIYQEDVEAMVKWAIS